MFLICSPAPRILVYFQSRLILYGEELLAPSPNPKLEDHPLSAVRHFLFNKFAAVTGERLLHPQTEDAPYRGDKRTMGYIGY
jgi:hypothetical protein